MGQDGIICTDAGSLANMVNRHKYYADLPTPRRAPSRRASTSFSTASSATVHDALKKNLLSERDIDAVIENEFRVMIKLGMLDPPERVAYTRSRVMRTLGNWAITKRWRNSGARIGGSAQECGRFAAA